MKKNRILALLLCAVMVLSMLPVTSIFASSANLTIYFNGNAQSEVTLPKGGHIELSAVNSQSGSAAYQWQIAANGVWVDIAGETGLNIRVSYAMIANLLAEGKAQLRCEAVTEEETVYSDPVTVTVSDADPSAAVAIPEEADNYAVLPAPEAENVVITPPAVSSENYSVSVASAYSLEDEGIATADAEGTDEQEVEPPATVNIVIDYVFTDGDTAAQSYTAEVAVGSNFYATVSSPEIQGYLPYEGENAESTSSVTLDFTNIQADQTITVTYKPTLVNYTVVYKLQNVDGTAYEEDTRETKQGLTESIVPEITKVYDGFSMLWYDTPAIAADGSTVVEVYYERIFYLMLFELDGGYGVEPIYARYGTAVSVGTPSKAGYAFDSWSPEVPSTVPVGGGTYTAQWGDAQTVNYTVVYWKENPNDANYSYWGSETKSAITGTTVSGSDAIPNTIHQGEKKYFSYNSSLTDTNVIVAGDGSSIVNVYYKRNTYTLTFVTNELTCGTEAHEHTYTEYYTKGSGYNRTTYYIGGCYPDGDVNNRTGGATEGNTICGKNSHSHSSGRNGCYGTNKTVKTITAKYQQDIRSSFPIIGSNSANYSGYWWAVPSNATFFDPGTSVVSIDTMPGENLTFNGSYYGVDAKIFYYIETLSGSAGTHSYGGKQFDLFKTVITVLSGRLTYLEEFHDINGFTQWQSDPAFSSHDADGRASVKAKNFLYYTRNSYQLKFYNYNAYLTDNQVTVQYQAPLSSYNVANPPYPAQLEENAYQFEGWYTTEDCVEGTKVDFSAATMPASDMTLYANWIPVTHYVNIYKTNEMTDAVKIGETLEIPHGSMVPEADIPETPTNGNLKFVGWFYMDGEVEKAFDFNNMPVNKDLNIYAKWSDTTIVPYFIYFRAKDSSGNVILNDNGYPLEIADPITGQALTGLSRTFEAVSSDALIEGYKEGYFPETKSHTMVLSTDGSNSFIFYYVPVDAVPYEVQYKMIDADGNVLGPAILNEDNTEYIKKVEDNRKAVVTETFEVVPGYMPDAYQKRLVVSADGKNNVIIFYYIKDEAHAYYLLSHYTENIGEGWTEYASSQAIGDVGTTYDAQPMTIPGFTYDQSKTEIIVGESTTHGTSHKLTTAGLEIRHYYTRNEYPYEVRYLEAETDKELHTAKTGSGKYGDVIAENMLSIPGYTCISPATQSITIRIEENATAEKNIITFYYEEADVTIQYVPVPEAGGSVSVKSETIKAISGTPSGSAATAAEGYSFVGWFSDPSCTVKVSDTAEFVPSKTGNLYTASVYYALFQTNEYPYEIRYLEQDTNKELHSPLTGTENFGETVSAEPISIANYSYVSAIPDSKTITIQVDGATVTKNIITFYYVENQVTLNYVAVGPEGVTNFGTVDPESEKVNVLTGTASGSTANANENFRFVGWYATADCSGEALSTDPKYVPTKTEGTAWVDGTTYYAKFEYDVTDLTVNKVLDKAATEDMTFLLTVSATSNDSFSRTVVVNVLKGSTQGSVTISGLKVGATYSITEKTDWSWRYEPDNETEVVSIKLTANGNSATFKNKLTSDKWLTFTEVVTNLFKKAKKGDSDYVSR